MATSSYTPKTASDARHRSTVLADLWFNLRSFLLGYGGLYLLNEFFRERF